MLTAAVAIAVVVIVGFWVAGVFLRLGGLVVAIFGVIALAVDHSLALVLAVGMVLWLVGHWHSALRHHVYKSPLAQRIFQQLLPGDLDPPRGWLGPLRSLTDPGCKSRLRSR